MKPNPKLAAINIGEALKYVTSLNQIHRIASAIFPFPMEEFPVDGITSKRSLLIYNWLMTLFKQKLPDDVKLEYLRSFLLGITPFSLLEKIEEILRQAGIPLSLRTEGQNPRTEDERSFDSRNFHPQVVQHARPLFIKGLYLHAVFEATKAFNARVKELSGVQHLDGQRLMNYVFSTDKPIIKVSPCRTQTEKDIQDGYRALASGLMAAIRNPTAHEPALFLPMGREEALEILSLISYLFRYLEKASVPTGETES